MNDTNQGGSTAAPSVSIRFHRLSNITFMFLLHQFPRGQGERMEPEAWVNALLGRVFWDFLGEKYWANMVSKKIQMKLSKIRVRSATLS